MFNISSFIRNSFFLLVLALFCNVDIAVASEVEEEVKFREDFLSGQELTVDNALGVESFDELYLIALKHFNADEFAEGLEVLDKLSLAARRKGYVNLPIFSLKLIAHAKLFASEHRTDKAAFLIRRAIELSPNDASVLYASSTFYNTIGYKESFSNLLQAAMLLKDYPKAVVAILGTLLIVGMSAFTLSFLLVCIAQLACNAKLVLINFQNIFPAGLRGIGGPLLLAGVLLGPLPFGILAIGAVWGVILSRYVRGCRWLGVMAGVVTIGWWLTIPIVHTLSAQLQSPINLVIQNVQNKSYQGDIRANLGRAITRNPRDEMAIFSLAAELLHRGEFSDAESYFNAVRQMERTGNGMGILDRVITNLGVIKYKQGDFSAAKELFLAAKELGNDSLELMYNLSQVHLALLDTEGHRDYYNNVVAIDKLWVERYEKSFEADGATAPKVLSLGVPSSDFYLRFLAPPYLTLNANWDSRKESRDLFAASLFSYGSLQLILFFGVLVTIIGFINSKQGRILLDRSHSSLQKASQIWLIVPAGTYLVNQKTGAALFVLTTLLLLMLLGLGEPTHLFADEVATSQLRDVLFGMGAVFFVISILLSLSGGQRCNEAN